MTGWEDGPSLHYYLFLLPDKHLLEKSSFVIWAAKKDFSVSIFLGKKGKIAKLNHGDTCTGGTFCDTQHVKRAELGVTSST